ncbi:cytochrome P450 [Streptomyces sp. LP05-1]|uniref:Cytochrome P450 n=1 Tax=Streptomyces pyxinae TaxID=2970734 RepID=A0ABT2CD43_9ACTN|nr:cytochrome P450 [Streptomyces sp. LP05-1]MCS0635303.1 cytochrome P450 [Streptomyces sp. LP05-1]
MLPPPRAVTCTFHHSRELDFDPQLARLMRLGPISRVRLPHGAGEAWLVTSFEGVRKVTTDPRFSRAAVAGRDYPRLTPEPIVSPESINVMDPPRSTRLRALVAQAFTPQAVQTVRPAVQRITDGLLDRMADHGPPADLVRHLSDPLPHQLICELLGVPPADRERLRREAHRLLATGAGAGRAAAEAKAALHAYFAGLVTERHRTPGEDLISALARARQDADGADRLTDRELAVMAATLLLSGLDTSTCQISDIGYLFLSRPHLSALLRAHPEMLPAMVAEALRYIPFRKGVGIPRVATEDVELCGVVIRAGEYVHVSYLAANRDPGRYVRPDVLDPYRPARAHMTFGWGGHHCPAASLATTELEIAVGSLFARFPELRLAAPPDEVEWDEHTIRRFPLRLPVRW